VIGGLLWLLGDEDETPAVAPTINTFAVSDSTISMGGSINTTWDIVDVDRVELVRSSTDTEQRYDLAPDVTGYEMAFEQTGRYTLTLIAYHDELTTTAAAQIEVLPIIAFELHPVDGVELVRNVQQDVYASWQVQGAQTFDNGYKVWLERADVLTPILPAPLPLVDEYTFPVVITSDQPEWMVTLYAEGQDGVVASITQTIQIVYPSCELSAESTVVRKGPDEQYEAVIPPLESPAEGNLSFSPLARDPSGEWMQVTVSLDNARLGWVKRADFNCTNFDPARLVQTSNYPVLPDVTATSDDSATPNDPTSEPSNTD
ncbi:MAG: hypothetical protein JXA10_11880, partial [Anaerolineae bacterium]|nr:hypothetical protein [Anaerolineae bacterium]